MSVLKNNHLFAFYEGKRIRIHKVLRSGRIKVKKCEVFKKFERQNMGFLLPKISFLGPKYLLISSGGSSKPITFYDLQKNVKIEVPNKSYQPQVIDYYSNEYFLGGNFNTLSLWSFTAGKIDAFNLPHTSHKSTKVYKMGRVGNDIVILCERKIYVASMGIFEKLKEFSNFKFHMLKHNSQNPTCFEPLREISNAFAVGYDMGDIFLWDVTKVKSPWKKISIHKSLIISLKCFDRKFILSSSVDSTVKIYDLDVNKIVGTHDVDKSWFLKILGTNTATHGNSPVFYGSHDPECLFVKEIFGNKVIQKFQSKSDKGFQGMCFIDLSRIEHCPYSEVFVEQTRMEFLIENAEKYLEIEIQFKNKRSIRLSKPLLTTSHMKIKKKTKLINLENVNCALSQEKILGVLFGKSVVSEDIFEFFKFFEALEMKNEMLVLLRQIKHETLDVLLTIFAESLRYYEKQYLENLKREDIDDVLASLIKMEYGNMLNNEFRKFKSTLSIQVFNMLKVKEKEILGNVQFLKIFEKLNLLNTLKSYRVVPVSSHSYFKNEKIEKQACSSFSALFHWKMKNLFSSGKHYNLSLIPNDKGEALKVHKEILIYQSEYFYRMMNFGGIESNSVDELKIEFLNSTELSHLLEFVYNKYVSTKDFGVLLKLHEHAGMYFEKELLEYLPTEIQSIVELNANDLELEILVLEYGKQILSLPKKLKNVIMKIITEFIPVKKLELLLEYQEKKTMEKMEFEGKIENLMKELKEEEVKTKLLSEMIEKFAK